MAVGVRCCSPTDRKICKLPSLMGGRRAEVQGLSLPASQPVSLMETATHFEAMMKQFALKLSA